MEGVEQIEFYAEKLNEGADPRNGATAGGQAEGDLIIGAGAGDVERLPVNRHR